MIKRVRLRNRGGKSASLAWPTRAARLLPKGTVIVSRTASVGFSAIMGVDMATTQDFVNWVCGPGLRSEYLLYVSRSMRQELRRLMMGSTHQTIYMPDCPTLSTPIPPLPEAGTDRCLCSEGVSRDRCAGGEEGAADRATSGKARRPHSPTLSQRPRFERSDEESGVGWLGDIPRTGRPTIKWAARMESGHTPDKKVDSYWKDGNIPWISLADTGQLRKVDYIQNTRS